VKRPGFLWSYYYFREGGDREGDPRQQLLRIFGADRPSIFLDSGAYSAFAQAQPIRVSDYADYLDRYGSLFDHVASLDVIQDPEGSKRNLQFLRERGHQRVLPVFHGGEPWSLFEDYCESSDYVALGGIAGANVSVKDPRVLRWLDKAFLLADHHGTDLHGFGLSAFQVLRGFPWASIDSTAWHSGIRWGQVRLFDHYRRRWVSFKLADQRAWHRYGWLVREQGFEPNAYGNLRHIGSGRPEVVQLLAATWSEAAKCIAETNPDFQLYLVDDNPQHQTWGNEGVRRWLDKKKTAVAA
jgi:hypothetical protein